MRQGWVSLRDIELTYFEWGLPEDPRSETTAGTSGSPKDTILMLHATGFHARCWDGVVRALGGGFHVVAPDQRGHGRSTKRGPYDWREFGADAAGLVDALDLHGVIGVGHSMGGHALVQAAQEHPDRFRGLLLVDPVILDPAAYRERQTFGSATDHPVSRRRNRWASPEEMIERFADRHPFRLWAPDVLEDYCRHGLNPDGDGYVLGCPPIVEASIYLGSAGVDIYAAIRKLTLPVVVLRAQGRNPQGPGREAMDFSKSPTWEDLAAAFPNGRDVHRPDLTHFIPMQRPDVVADELRRLVDLARPRLEP